MDLDAFDQQLHQIALQRPVSIVQSVRYGSRQRHESSIDRLDVWPHRDVTTQAFQCRSFAVVAFTKRTDTLLEFLTLEQAQFIAIDQTIESIAEIVHCFLEHFELLTG